MGAENTQPSGQDPTAGQGQDPTNPASGQAPETTQTLAEVQAALAAARREAAAHRTEAAALKESRARLWRLPPHSRGRRHAEGAQEEIFVVLEGGGVLELWERGAERPTEQPLRAGDVISRPPGTGVAHALRPGAEGLTYLAYGTREPGDMCFYPQSGRVSLRGLGIALRSPEIEVLPGL